MNKFFSYVLICIALVSFPLTGAIAAPVEGSTPEPLAKVGSHWNYWFAREHSYGFRKYKVTAHETIRAAVDRNGNGKKDADEVEEEILAAKIEIWRNETWQNSTEPGKALKEDGTFYAFREGNKSYVLRDVDFTTGDMPKKFWFKWIDMDAEPGDSWVITQFGQDGNTVYDWAEVSYKRELDIDGRKVPVIKFSPACYSRYSKPEDFTSRIALNGLFNIDFWEVSGGGSPIPVANGVVFAPQMYEMSAGLLCANVNDMSLATSQLENYVRNNNPTIYEQYEDGYCELLQAPEGSGARSMIMQTPVHLSDSAAFTVSPQTRSTPRTVALLSEDEVIKLPVVVHVVYNPNTPSKSITEAQAQKMIDELNRAYGSTDMENVREPFKGVVGNPHIQFELAKVDPSGNTTTGVVYHQTKESAYLLQGTTIWEKYAYKFEDDLTPRNWDHKRYINIYVVDLGGWNELSTVGGFVTNPESGSAYQAYLNWVEKQDMTFWQSWLDSEEGSMLDGLTVDVYYTFGGRNEINDKATFKTAIHELGHYFGLRHPNVVLVDKNGIYVPVDDGFEDTPYTQFTQYAVVGCEEPVFQCGHLVQTENYMDYALDCACMFTKEQAAFMRKFVAESRPGLNVATGISDISQSEVKVSPTVARKEVFIEGEFMSAQLFNLEGVEVIRIEGDRNVISVENLTPGMYILQVSANTKDMYKFKIVVLDN
ncbi:T9SS type A sorting domain-containing protein [Bacteroides sp. K03]|uniref:zinc-dependent metalloprotease n=1 Tax=Bacteroides sp. K03 TaxID=2718928 RepID=UPI001C8CB59F|nr:zinc-dependent metalloprotease [Bacteroides sp. K03]MBX9189550.1 T9SS type A sorting domain-containing protein [Bacteroides sp. K03]